MQAGRRVIGELAQPGAAGTAAAVFDLDSADDRHFALMGCDGRRWRLDCMLAPGRSRLPAWPMLMKPKSFRSSRGHRRKRHLRPPRPAGRWRERWRPPRPNRSVADRDRQALRRGRGVCRPAPALGCRAHFRLAQSQPTPCQGFRSQPEERPSPGCSSPASNYWRVDWADLHVKLYYGQTLRHGR
jgi:hypothetical protein